MSAERKKPVGFVPLSSLTGKPADPGAVLAEIRRIYFNTRRQTVEHDLLHAIELLKSLDSEDDRDRAAVYMDGLAQMRSEWKKQSARKTRR